jgi:hypothetical protein
MDADIDMLIARDAKSRSLSLGERVGVRASILHN